VRFAKEALVLGKLAWGSIIIPAALVACSSSSSSSGLAEVDAKDASAEAADAGAESNAPDATSDAPAFSAHVGDDCNKASDCAGLSSPLCLGAAGDDNSVNPTPVCVGSCPADGIACDGTNGFCLDDMCMPACEASTTQVTKPCAGKNVCVLQPKGAQSATAPGYCLGGCRADADCASGNRCQVETGYCTKTLRPSRIAGAPCTNENDCPCVLPEEKTGYCSPFCVVGDDTCPAGFTCNIPYTLDSFGGNPEGVAGRCLKTCATAADCPVAGETLIGWQCQEIAGHAKVCTPAEEQP
jgi:hypothetical protein